MCVCSAGEKANLQKEAECEMVVCADDPALMDKLDRAAEEGELGTPNHLTHTISRDFYMTYYSICYQMICPFVTVSLFSFLSILTFGFAGLRVLVTNMERVTPSPQFLARLVRPAGCCLPGTEQHVQPTHPEFCLFLATHLPVQLLGSGEKDL